MWKHEETWGQELKNSAFISVEEKLHLTTVSDCVVMEVLTKGPVLEWTNSGKLQEHFLMCWPPV